MNIAQDLFHRSRSDIPRVSWWALGIAVASCSLACGGDKVDGGADSDSTTSAGALPATVAGASASSGGAAVGAGPGTNAGPASNASGASGSSGGSVGAGGSGTTTGVSSNTSGGSTSACGGLSISLDLNPFGCELAWGANGNDGGRSSYLDFITTWVGYEANGGLEGDCDGCGLVSDLAGTSAVPVYYAYLIGYMTSEDGYGDCNTDFDGQNLCTHGAQWIRENRERLIEAYANYARMSYEANRDKPVVWLLEGDFIQYTYEEQTEGLSIQELSQLATDIICAIKSNAPNAVVSVNHSAWISNELTDEYWGSLPLELIDMVWTTGVGNNEGYINASGSPTEYNGETARYEYLHRLTNRGILVDTSFGASQQNDSWSGETQSELNQRIAEGVIAVNVTQPPRDYQSRVSGMQLDSTCN